MLPSFLGDGSGVGGAISWCCHSHQDPRVQPSLGLVGWELVPLNLLGLPDLQELSQPPGLWHLNTSHPSPTLTWELFVKAHSPPPQCLSP